MILYRYSRGIIAGRPIEQACKTNIHRESPRPGRGARPRRHRSLHLEPGAGGERAIPASFIRASCPGAYRRRALCHRRLQAALQRVQGMVRNDGGAWQDAGGLDTADGAD
ncbi:MAG: hypothetical protein LBB61_09345, partial [Treponema sp.]|nr:hypothetical protein [Treponema sp.]